MGDGGRGNELCVALHVGVVRLLKWVSLFSPWQSPMVALLEERVSMPWAREIAVMFLWNCSRLQWYLGMRAQPSNLETRRVARGSQLVKLQCCICESLWMECVL